MLKKLSLALAISAGSISGVNALGTDWNWGLDRIDGSWDGEYTYTHTGAGQTVYILDSGLNLNLPKVAAEFGGRAEIYYDFNQELDPSNPNYVTPGHPNYGNDCTGHGSRVASIVGGNQYGVAKGVSLKIVKITEGCHYGSMEGAILKSFKYLAENGNPGDIVNMSYGFSDTVVGCKNPNRPIAPYTEEEAKLAEVEYWIKKAHDRGLIILISAGNDACDTKDYANVNLPEVFTVSSTTNLRLLPNAYHPNGEGIDEISSRLTVDENGELIPYQRDARIGANVSAYAPGQSLWAMGADGNRASGVNGTSFASPMVAGVFAVACEANAGVCTSGDTANIYSLLRSTGTTNTVYDADRSTILTNPWNKARFITQQW